MGELSLGHILLVFAIPGSVLLFLYLAVKVVKKAKQ